jgi:hypothetical protein
VDVAGGNSPTATPTTPPTEQTQVPGGDDGNDGAAPTATEVIAADDSNGGDGEGNDDGAGETPEQPEQTPTEEPEETPPTEGADDGGIGAGDIVIVNSAEVRFRSEPRVADDTFIRDLDNGEELTVTGPLQESEGVEWYPVIDKDGEEGFVAAQYVQLAE